MNATKVTRKGQMERTANIVKARVNVTVLHALLSLSLKLVTKLKPAQVALELLPQDLQDHIPGNTATFLNLFNDVKKNRLEYPSSTKLKMRTI